MILRFDDYDTREERRRADRFAAVRQISKLFSASCTLHWNPLTHVTVDEAMLSYRWVSAKGILQVKT